MQRSMAWVLGLQMPWISVSSLGRRWLCGQVPIRGICPPQDALRKTRGELVGKGLRDGFHQHGELLWHIRQACLCGWSHQYSTKIVYQKCTAGVLVITLKSIP